MANGREMIETGVASSLHFHFLACSTMRNVLAPKLNEYSTKNLLDIKAVIPALFIAAIFQNPSHYGHGGQLSPRNLLGA
jgi:hypothetical protein